MRKFNKMLAGAIALNLSQATLAAACGPYELHAHRGAPSAPENTKTSVSKAFSMNYDAVEIDLQVLKDGEWVLLHDPVVGRSVKAPPNSGLGAITNASKLTSDQWSEMVVLDRRGQSTNEDAPFLRDVLMAIQNRSGEHKKLHVEIKGSPSCENISYLNEQMDNHLGADSWKAASFNLESLSCLRRTNPNVYLGVIVGPEQNGTHLQVDKVKDWANKVGGKVGQFVQKQAANYENAYNRNYLTNGKFDGLVKRFAPMGLHVDATTLAALPTIALDAKNAGAKLLTYSSMGDEYHLQQLAQAKRASSMMPHGMIIDGTPEQFCQEIKKRGL